MSFMQIPTVDSMRKSMQVKTQEYKLPAKPTPEQVKKLCRAITKNLDGFDSRASFHSQKISDGNGSP